MQEEEEGILKWSKPLPLLVCSLPVWLSDPGLVSSRLAADLLLPSPIVVLSTTHKGLQYAVLPNPGERRRRRGELVKQMQMVFHGDTLVYVKFTVRHICAVCNTITTHKS